jgi:hypothetical protein
MVMPITTISRPPTPTKLVLTTMLAAPGTWVKLNPDHPLVGKYGAQIRYDWKRALSTTLHEHVRVDIGRDDDTGDHFGRIVKVSAKRSE